MYTGYNSVQLYCTHNTTLFNLLLHVHNGESSGYTYLVNHQHCYWSQGCFCRATLPSKWRKEQEGLGKGKKDDGINEKAHHWAFSRWCFAGTCQVPRSASFTVKWTAYCIHVCELTVIDSVCMCGLLLIGGGQMWLHHTLCYMANLMYCWCWQQFCDFLSGRNVEVTT